LGVAQLPPAALTILEADELKACTLLSAFMGSVNGRKPPSISTAGGGTAAANDFTRNEIPSVGWSLTLQRAFNSDSTASGRFRHATSAAG